MTRPKNKSGRLKAPAQTTKSRGPRISRETKFTVWMTLVGVIVGAVIGGLLSPFLQHGWDTSSRKQEQRRAAYANFIVQVHKGESVITDAFNKENADVANPKTRKDAATHFLDATAPLTAPFLDAETQVELAGPDSVIQIASRIGNDFTKVQDIGLPRNTSPPPLENPQLQKVVTDLRNDINAFTEEGKKFS
jgi:hypothetical protein